MSVRSMFHEELYEMAHKAVKKDSSTRINQNLFMRMFFIAKAASQLALRDERDFFFSENERIFTKIIKFLEESKSHRDCSFAEFEPMMEFLSNFCCNTLAPAIWKRAEDGLASDSQTKNREDFWLSKFDNEYWGTCAKQTWEEKKSSQHYDHIFQLLTSALESQYDRHVLRLVLDFNFMKSLLFCFLKCASMISEKSEFNIDARFEEIAGFFGLSETEKKILFILLFDAEDDYVRWWANGVFNRSNGKTTIARLNRMFRVGDFEIKRIINKLLDLGLIVLDDSASSNNDNKHNNHDNYVLSELMNNMVSLLETPIETIVFPNSVSCSAKIDDYASLSKEFEISSKLINSAINNGVKGINIFIHGKPGYGKTQFATLLCQQNGLNARFVGESDLNNLSIKSAKNSEMRMAALKLSEYVAFKSASCDVLIFDEAEDLLYMPKASMNRIIENNRVPIIWISNTLGLGQHIVRRMSYTIGFDRYLDWRGRAKIWRNLLADTSIHLSEQDIERLAKKDIPPSSIEKTVHVINEAELCNVDEIMSVVSSSAEAYNFFSDKTAMPNSDTHEIFIPGSSNAIVNDDSDLGLESFTNSIVESGETSFSILMSGPPGTGKSAYAKYLASRMGIDYMLVAASTLLGRYVGESEKRIAEMFSEASKLKKMIIIDEADGLFTTRGMARQSFQLTQVNEMLLHMVEFKYPFVCTTNLTDMMDDAAMSRFIFKIKYDFLNGQQIDELCVQYFGEALPINTESLDMLVPRDIVNVSKRAKLLKVVDVERLAKMLESEQAGKNKRTSIGFSD